MHDNILLKCHFCPWTGVKHNDYVSHLNSHFKIATFSCSLCSAKFFGLSAKKRHEWSVHENLPRIYKCGSCEFNTLSYNSYEKHLESCDKRDTISAVPVLLSRMARKKLKS